LTTYSPSEDDPTQEGLRILANIIARKILREGKKKGLSAVDGKAVKKNASEEDTKSSDKRS
jgi:hypothetical protein